MGSQDDRSDDPTIDRRRGGAAGPGDLPEGLEVGEYRVIRKIGEGGMGAVYSAVQPVIGKRVAIKVLAAHIANNPELVRRFVDEARAVNKIGHPNIVDIFSFGWLPDGRHYFAMEFLDGQSLADWLKKGPSEGPPNPPRSKAGRFENVEARRLLRQICQALEAAHRQGIVHRDLKPDNIWIVQPQHGDSYAKLLDFGIAKLVSEGEGGHRTQTGVIMGTPAYMSPEQCRGVGVDERTDIYALGVILYEMFAGRLPFQGSFAELITHHLTTVPAPPSKHAPVPPALDTVIVRCLDKDPANRPASAEALGQALEAALSSIDGPALPAAGVSPVVSPVQGPAPAAPSSAASPPSGAAPDTFAPPPGRTLPGVTELPARDTRARTWAFVVAAGVGLAVVVAIVAGRREATKPPAVAAPEPVTRPAAPPPAPAVGRVHVVVQGAERARVLVDGRLVAEGVREARIADVAAGLPHQLRVEADGRPPHERTFTVAAGAEVELAVNLPGTGPAAAKPEAPSTGRPRKRDKAGPSPAAAGASPAPPKPRHRDGLVGEDIFESPR